MFEEVAATDIDHEGELGAKLGDVGVVLIGADSEIDAAAGKGAEAFGDREERRLVGDEIVGVEVAFRLREFGDQGGKFGRVEGAGGGGAGEEKAEEGSQTPHDLLS